MPKRAGKWIKSSLPYWSAACITLLALVSISPYGSDFRISVGVVLLPVLAFMVRDMPVVYTSLLAGVGVFLVRFAGFWMEGAFAGTAALSAWPEMIFYWAYGGFLALVLRKIHLQPLRLFGVLPLVGVDFAANMVELALRLGAGVLAWDKLWPLLFAAVVRAVMAGAAMWVLQRYGLLVLRRQDAQRYRRLLLMTSMLNSELFWLQKSAATIENTMASAYGLYSGLAEAGADKQYVADAMNIATDIHEVKKEYLLIVRGIEDALKASTQRDGMRFSEICDILQDSLRRTGPAMTVQLFIGQDFYTRQHYPLMSVLHNLLANAVEAANGAARTVTLRQKLEGERFVIEVEDDCGGIPPDTIGHIFLPGFSSKMDSDTGVLNRGLGLCLVKELVEEHFKGEIEVYSEEGHSRFVLTLPRRALEGEA